MERQTNSQLELFSESSSDSSLRVRPDSGNNFFKRVRGYEKVILLIIAILVTGIVSFSFGVERGKRVVLSAKIKPIEIVKVESASPPVVPEVPQVMVKKEPLLKVAPAEAVKGTFTIQVASFKTKGNAVKEAEAFKKKGLVTQIINKGNYSILCVGNFPNKETAQPLLSELSRRYKSCYIRRL